MQERKQHISRKLAPVALVVASTVANQAFAALPTGAETVFTTVATDAATVIGYVFTAVLAIAGGFAGVRLVKRGIRAAV